MNINKFGKYKEGLTSEEILKYLINRLEKLSLKDIKFLYKRWNKSYEDDVITPSELIERFNKIAGVNTMPCKVIKGKLTTLMYRHDVERFTDKLFEGKKTYWD